MDISPYLIYSVRLYIFVSRTVHLRVVVFEISRDDFFLLHRYDKSENQEDEDEEGGEILSLKCVSNMRRCTAPEASFGDSTTPSFNSARDLSFVGQDALSHRERAAASSSAELESEQREGLRWECCLQKPALPVQPLRSSMQQSYD